MNNIEKIQNNLKLVLDDLKIPYNPEKLFLTKNSLRLAYHGHKVLNEHFDHFVYQFDSRKLTTKHYTGFNYIEVPFWISDSSIIVYSNFDACTINICGSVEDYLKALLI